MRNREERDAMELDALYGWVGIENHVEEDVATLVGTQPDHSSGKEPGDRSSLIHTLSGFFLLSFNYARASRERNRQKTQQ